MDQEVKGGVEMGSSLLFVYLTLLQVFTDLIQKKTETDKWCGLQIFFNFFFPEIKYITL